MSYSGNPGVNGVSYRGFNHRINGAVMNSDMLTVYPAPIHPPSCSIVTNTPVSISCIGT